MMVVVVVVVVMWTTIQLKSNSKDSAVGSLVSYEMKKRKQQFNKECS